MLTAKVDQEWRRKDDLLYANNKGGWTQFPVFHEMHAVLETLPSFISSLYFISGFLLDIFLIYYT